MDMPADNVVYNEDTELVAKLKAALLSRDGYCPCRIQRIPDNLCPCREFREQIADPSFSGLCHCRLYRKLPAQNNIK